MSLSFIFDKSKSWLKEKIGPRIAGHLTIPPELLSIHGMKYIPYLPWKSVRVVPLLKDTGVVLCKSGLPIPPQDLRYGYGDTPEEYIQSGERDVECMLRLLSDTGFQLGTGYRVLDLGCAAGRMIRHLKSQSDTCEIWGSDINANAIYWAKLNLGKYFRFATTTTLPHLPFEDRYFDLIYCGSVFTHIDDLAEAWFLELRRLVSLRGRLYITIHDESTLVSLKTRFRDHSFARWVKNFLPQAMVEQRTWGMITVGKGPGCQVFYDVEHLKGSLKPFLDVLSVTPEAYGYQTALIMARKNHSPN